MFCLFREVDGLCLVMVLIINYVTSMLPLLPKVNKKELYRSLHVYCFLLTSVKLPRSEAVNRRTACCYVNGVSYHHQHWSVE